MNADTMVTGFLFWGAVCATFFVFAYPILSDGWSRRWIGWALLISSIALALLLDLAVASRMFGEDYLARPYLRVSVTFLVALGATLKVVALLSAKVQAAMSRRA